TATATGVTAFLTTSTPDVFIDQPNGTYGTIAVGATATNPSPFKIHFTTGFMCATNVDFTITATTTSDGTFTSTFRLPTSFGIGSSAQFDNNTVTPLIDSGVVDIPFMVSGLSSSVAHVTASFYLTHTFDSDLVISL